MAPRALAGVIARIVATALAYAGAVAFVTWPLATGLATRLPYIAGGFVSDQYYAGWALAWQTHALLTDPGRFADANIYAGAPHALFYGPLGFGLLPVFAPIFAATNDVTLALNGTMLLNFILAATAIHRVIVDWTGSEWAGAAAGAMFVAAPGTLGRFGNIPQYAALAAMPLIIWQLARPTRTARGTVVLAVLVAVQACTDVIYLAVPVFLTAGFVAAVRLARVETRADGRRIVLALILAALAIAPICATYAAVYTADSGLRSVWGGAPARLWVDPATKLPVGNFPLTLDRLVFAPIVVGLLVSLGRAPDATPWRAWRQAGLWFLFGLTFTWVLPVLVPPYRRLVAGSVARDVLRLAYPALVGVCLLVGLGFAAVVGALAARMPARLASAALLAAWLVMRFDHAPWAGGDYPVAAAPVLGPEAGLLRASAGPVLELPIGDLGKNTASHATAMYRSTEHWRTLLNGYSSYQPATFVENMELAQRLPNAAALDELRARTGLSTIVVRAGAYLSRTIGAWQYAIASGALPGARIDYADADVMVISVSPED